MDTSLLAAHPDRKRVTPLATGEGSSMPLFSKQTNKKCKGTGRGWGEKEKVKKRQRSSCLSVAFRM